MMKSKKQQRKSELQDLKSHTHILTNIQLAFNEFSVVCASVRGHSLNTGTQIAFNVTPDTDGRLYV